MHRKYIQTECVTKELKFKAERPKTHNNSQQPTLNRAQRLNEEEQQSINTHIYTTQSRHQKNNDWKEIVCGLVYTENENRRH